MDGFHRKGFMAQAFAPWSHDDDRGGGGDDRMRRHSDARARRSPE